MRMRGLAVGAALWLSASGLALGQGEVTVPLGGGEEGIGELQLAQESNVPAAVERAPGEDSGEPSVRVSFGASGAEPRLLALSAPCSGLPDVIQSVDLRLRLSMDQGEAPRIAVALFEGDESCWFKVSHNTVELGRFVDLRLSVLGLKQAAFSDDTTGSLEWGAVSRVWVGLLLEGPARGTLDLSRAHFTSRPYRADQPLPIAADEPGEWRVSKDPVAMAVVTTPGEGPNGEPCMKLEFSFPGHKHMYVIPSIPVPAAGIAGYSALRLQYKATLAAGVKVLLMLTEERAQYWVQPAPPATDEWTTLTVPFDDFTLGSWSEDPNGRLDMEAVTRISVGVEGVAEEDETSGAIWATGIEFVP